MLCYTGNSHQETPNPLGFSIEFNRTGLSTNILPMDVLTLIDAFITL